MDDELELEFDNDLAGAFRDHLRQTGVEAGSAMERHLMNTRYGFAPRQNMVMQYDIETQSMTPFRPDVDWENPFNAINRTPRRLSDLAQGMYDINHLYPEVMLAPKHYKIEVEAQAPRLSYVTTMTCQFVDSSEAADALANGCASLAGVSDDKIKQQTGFSRISRKTIEVKR